MLVNLECTFLMLTFMAISLLHYINHRHEIKSCLFQVVTDLDAMLMAITNAIYFLMIMLKTVINLHHIYRGHEIEQLFLSGCCLINAH